MRRAALPLGLTLAGRSNKRWGASAHSVSGRGAARRRHARSLALAADYVVAWRSYGQQQIGPEFAVDARVLVSGGRSLLSLSLLLGAIC